MSIFEQWDNSIDVEALAREVKEIKKNGGTGNFPEVPVGKYEIKIDNMEVKKSSKGNYMFAAQFRIVAGEHKNQCLFNEFFVGFNSMWLQKNNFNLLMVNTYLEEFMEKRANNIFFKILLLTKKF